MDIAQRLRSCSGREDVRIEITGLRRGGRGPDRHGGDGRTSLPPQDLAREAERIWTRQPGPRVWKVRGRRLFTGPSQVPAQHQPHITDFSVPRAAESAASVGTRRPEHRPTATARRPATAVPTREMRSRGTAACCARRPRRARRGVAGRRDGTRPESDVERAMSPAAVLATPLPDW
ncbi:hypothetical protein QJS66_00225 [Kocuria rhizophila]|nr:hypothetical protein QJS66_00225 [Kocuria rhizophila]